MNDLCQFFTPFWMAESLVDRHFSKLDAGDIMLEPSCGPGAFLQAVPRFVDAVGVEIDPQLADRARLNSNRNVITGDFLHVDIKFTPTAIIGNPPFRASVIDKFLQRCHTLLPEGGRAGFILPAYYFKAHRLTELSEVWSITGELLPKSAFSSRIQEPLLFALFSKDVRRLMVGFALFHEEADRQDFATRYRNVLANQTGSAWRAVCELALERLGGEATLKQIYDELENNRPSRSPWWREKIRQTLRAYKDFTAIEAGRYRLTNLRQARLLA